LILYHGTGARRKQSIKRRGLLPKPSSFVFASPIRLIGVVFAAARSELEDDFGLLVSFEAEEKWKEDPLFPLSVRSRKSVKPEKIIAMKIVKPDEELKGNEFLWKLVKSIRLPTGQLELPNVTTRAQFVDAVRSSDSKASSVFSS